MAGRLSGKKIIITAAAQGIGRACVEAYQADGGCDFDFLRDPSLL